MPARELMAHSGQLGGTLTGVMRIHLAAGVAALALAAAEPARASTLTASPSVWRTCSTQVAPGTPGTAHTVFRSPQLGLVTATLRGLGDWDLAVFDAVTGRYVGGSAQPRTRELAQGFTLGDRDLLIQACRVGGDARSVELSVRTQSIGALDTTFTEKLVEVDAPTHADRSRLVALGLDLTEHGRGDARQVVIHSAGDEARLRAAGFEPRTVVGDLLTLARKNLVANRNYARNPPARGDRAFPSGRTEYRHLADYEAEMKKLAGESPGLVRLITLPHRSLIGRPILGLEIAENVTRVDDGRPVFAQFGVHHAREWPSGEHAMEWAYELVNGYKSKNARVLDIVRNSRTIVVPIVNVDGFNLSREAPVDAGNVLAAIDLPEAVDNPDVLPITDPTYTSALLLDQTAGAFAYKRRNCRIVDGEPPAEGACENPDNRTLGVDNNRNYGALWGGPGASVETTDDTYRGAAPFSEPETQNVRELVSSRQVTALITNHTFSNLVLRPPGVRAQGPPPDEGAYKALSDAMTANNGYASIPGYQLYDTTGTTEDWSYAATGGFGFTFEIGPDEFHPPFPEAVAEYDGAGQYEGKGNREAYFLAAEWAVKAANHSVLKGKAPRGATLRLRKSFMTETSEVVLDTEGKTGPPIRFEDKLSSELTVGDSGRFSWHVNPSTRPAVMKDRTISGVDDTPKQTIDISSVAPVPPGMPALYEFTVPADAARQIRASIAGALPVDDYDIYLYEGSVADENQVSSSASADATESITYGYPKPGQKYILEVVNFSAAGPISGQITLHAPLPGTEQTIKATTEAWELDCAIRGKVVRSSKVEVERGKVLRVGNPCKKGRAAGKSKLRFSARLTKRSLRRSLGSPLRARARCSRRCRVSARLLASRSVSRRYDLGDRATVVARSKVKRLRRKGRTALTLRFTARARRALRGERGVRLTLVTSGVDAKGRKAGHTRRYVLAR